MVQDVIDISPSGDVILVVGPDQVQLRVASQALRGVSKPLNSMLSPTYSEGQDLDESCPKDVALPEDDANAFELVCNVIHHRNRYLPNVVNPEEVEQIAVLSEKYDCIEAMRFAAKAWLSPQLQHTIVDLEHLMVAAYLFGEAEKFSLVTQALVLQHTSSFRLLRNTDMIVHRLGWETLRT